jgi:hypothetical protein
VNIAARQAPRIYQRASSAVDVVVVVVVVVVEPFSIPRY